MLFFALVKYHLPPFDKCPLHFLRKVLNGQKKVSQIAWSLQLLKRNKVVEMLIPRFKELSVENIWPLVKVAGDLNEYFLDYKSNQLLERSFMFSIWATLRYDAIKTMVENARRNRALEVQDKGDELVYVNKKL